MGRATKRVQKTIDADVFASRYVVLMSGPTQVGCYAVGEFSLGISSLQRRELTEIVPINFGGRIESILGDAVWQEVDSVFRNWNQDRRRIGTRGSREIVGDLVQTFHHLGLIELNVLAGMPYSEAEKIFDSVLPSSVADAPLVDVISYLEKFQPNPADVDFAVKQRLASELLSGAQQALTWLTNHCRNIRSEIKSAMLSGVGTKSCDAVTAQYFSELKQVLPENEVDNQRVQLGKDIAGAVASVKVQTGSDDFQLRQLVALERANELKTKELELLAKKKSETTKARKSKSPAA